MTERQHGIRTRWIAPVAAMVLFAVVTLLIEHELRLWHWIETAAVGAAIHFGLRAGARQNS